MTTTPITLHSRIVRCYTLKLIVLSVAARGRESGMVHRFERELQIGVCDVNVRGGRLRVIDKEGDWSGGGGSDGDSGYRERRMII